MVTFLKCKSQNLRLQGFPFTNSRHAELTRVLTAAATTESVVAPPACECLSRPKDTTANAGIDTTEHMQMPKFTRAC